MKDLARRPLATKTIMISIAFTLSLAMAASAEQVKGDAFSVTLPDGFGNAQQQKQTVQSPSGPIHVVTYVSKAGDGSAVILGYSQLSGKIMDPDAQLTESRDSLLKQLGAQASNDHSMQVSGHPARTFNYTASSPRAVFGRTDLVVVGPRIYQLIYVGLTQDGLQKSDVQGMFSSFTVRESESNAMPTGTRGGGGGAGAQSPAN